MRRLAAAAALLSLTGCVTLPVDGAVHDRPESADASPAGTFDYDPPGPQPGDQQAAIVNGFVDALRETPLTFTAAREFLTEEANTSWAPNRRTIVYDDGAITTAVDGVDATVTLSTSVQLDSRGSWLGDPTQGHGLQLDLRLARSGDSWRITNPPDALVVPRSHFDTRYVRYDLHFFEPSATRLVPEPVYIPAGGQAPSLLVSSLLAGPDPELRTVERTFFPEGTRLEALVRVAGGVADVRLSEELLESEPDQLELSMAQLAWTLRQVSGIERMRVSVDGTPVDNRTGASVRSLQGWTSYDPAVPTAGAELYALRSRDLVVLGEQETLASTAFRSDPLRSIAVSLGSSTDDVSVAGVTANGRQVVSSVLPTLAGTGERARRVYSGTDVLRPAYDAFGHVWLVDRVRSGARLVVIDGGRTRTLRALGITGEDVTALALSRDGTRLAAIVDGRVVLARVSRTEMGRPIRVQPAVAVPLEQQAEGRAVDLAWTTPASLGVLVRLGPTISQIVFASVDGSFALNSEVTALEALFERADRVVTAPVPDAQVLLPSRSGPIYRVSATGQWAPVPAYTGLTALAFPG